MFPREQWGRNGRDKVHRAVKYISKNMEIINKDKVKAKCSSSQIISWLFRVMFFFISSWVNPFESLEHGTTRAYKETMIKNVFDMWKGGGNE